MPSSKTSTKKSTKKTQTKKANKPTSLNIKLSEKKRFLLFVAIFAVLGTLLVSAISASNAANLYYARPDYSKYTKLNVPDNGVVNKLDPNTDYHLIMPDKPLPQLNISGGRNVVVIGGSIKVDHEPQLPPTSANNPARQNRAMNLQNWTGHLYIEGLEVGGKWLFEGINANNKASDNPNAKITMQKIRFNDPILAARPNKFGEKATHWGGDLYQSWFQPAQGSYFSDWTVNGLTYQGFFFQDIGNGKSTNIEMNRMELRHATKWPTDAIKNSKWPADYFFNPGTFKYWAASGVNTFTIRDSYLSEATNGESRNWESQLSLKSSASKTNGSVLKGAPSKEFVPLGSVGIGYKPGSPPSTNPSPTPQENEPTPAPQPAPTPSNPPIPNDEPVNPAPSTNEPGISLKGLSNGRIVSQAIALEAIPVNTANFKQFDFYIDDTFINTERVAPYCLNGDNGACLNYDITNLPKGKHVVKVVMTYGNNQQVERKLQIDVDNSRPSNNGSETKRPSKPQNLSRTLRFDLFRLRYYMGISWDESTDNVGVTGYRLMRNNQELTSTKLTEYKDYNVRGNTAYNYSVQSFDAAGNVSLSNTINGQTKCYFVICWID